MKLGKLNFFSYILIILLKINFVFADNKIETVPLINLEDLSPTFEEDKSELDKIENADTDININETTKNSAKKKINNKVYVNLIALDKITAKTFLIKLAVDEIFIFGPLEIKALKCQISEGMETSDTVAYIQVKDLSSKDNNSVFLFNGWTFASSPTLQSIDHPVYDLWITGCENI